VTEVATGEIDINDIEAVEYKQVHYDDKQTIVADAKPQDVEKSMGRHDSALGYESLNIGNQIGSAKDQTLDRQNTNNDLDELTCGMKQVECYSYDVILDGGEDGGDDDADGGGDIPCDRLPDEYPGCGDDSGDDDDDSGNGESGDGGSDDGDSGNGDGDNGGDDEDDGDDDGGYDDGRCGAPGYIPGCPS
jgi:hypothetical protein